MKIYQGKVEFLNKDELLKNICQEKIGGKIYLDNGATVVSLHPGEILRRKELSVGEWFQYAINHGCGFPSDKWHYQTKNKVDTILKNIPLNKSVDCSLYEEDAFYKIYPNATEEDYDKLLYVYTNVKEYMETIEKTLKTPVNEIKYVCIDDEYFNWLENNNIEENQKNRMKYMTSMKDKDIERLWIKNHRNEYIYTCFLPVILHNENMFKLHKSNIELKKENIEFLLDLISKTSNIPKKAICVLNKLIRPDKAMQNEENFYEIYNNWFHNNQEANMDFISSNGFDKKGANILMRVLPIGIFEKCPYKYTKETATINSKIDICKEFSKKTDNLISNNLQTSIEYKVISTTGSIVYSNELEYTYNELIDSLKQAKQEMNVNSH